MKYKKIGIMGGTFDPIHNGHLVAASEVAARFNLDKVIFVPTGKPAFKQTIKVTPAENRYLMTVIATSSNPQFTVSRVDIDRENLTYTHDTIKDIKKEYGNRVKIYFITGVDALEQFLEWKNWKELLDMAFFVGVSRPNYNFNDLPKELLESNKFTKIEVPALAISSSHCRQRVKENLPVWYLVPDGVVQYIQKEQLYKSSF